MAPRSSHSPPVLSKTILALLAAGGAATAQGIVAVEEQKLVPTDVATFDFYGWSVALDGDTAVVGAYWEDGTATDTGAAHVYVRQGDAWVEQAELFAADAAQWDELSYAVALSGDTVAASIPKDDDLGENSGSVRVFVRSGTSWSQEARLTASDGTEHEFFGVALALDGDTLAVGKPSDDQLANDAGSVYVFTRSGTTWTQQAKLTASDAASGARFGTALALEGDALVVGAPMHPAVIALSGAAYVFRRSGTTWSEEVQLVAADGALLDRFGEAVALEGDTVVVGARRDDDLGNASGSAYVWERSGTTWTALAKLHAADGAAEALFGSSVALEGGVLVIGARTADAVSPGAGAAYVFTGAGASWTQAAKLAAHDGDVDDYFGWQVALSRGRVLVGSHRDDDPSPQSGAAYAYTLFTAGSGTLGCAGDGSGGTCPCGNAASGAGEGCLHSGGTGMTIAGSGTASVAADDLVLIATGCPVGNTGVFLAGKTLGAPSPVMDGLRCAGGETRLFRGRFQETGAVVDRDFVAQDSAGTFLLPGDTVHFQYWSRDIAGGPSPCGTASNFSPAYTVVMGP